ncbi:MAG: preprotein translocase subunit SecE [Cytophagales bacterium]
MFLLTFIKESFKEFKLVKWLPIKEIERLLFLFCIGFIVYAGFLFSVDYLLQKAQQAVYDWMQAKTTD